MLFRSLGRNSWRLRTSDIISSMLSTYLADHCPVVPIALMVSRLWSPRHVLWSNTLRHMAAISSSHTGSESKPHHDKSVVRSTCKKKSIGTRICLYSRYYSKIARHRATEYVTGNPVMACPLRVGPVFLFKLLSRFDKDYRATRVLASSKELVNG